VESVTVSDPEWSDDDLAAALAFEDDKAARCSGCGNYRDECMADGADLEWVAEPVACHACAARDRAAAAFQKEAKGETPGIFYRLFRRG